MEILVNGKSLEVIGANEFPDAIQIVLNKVSLADVLAMGGSTFTIHDVDYPTVDVRMLSVDNGNVTAIFSRPNEVAALQAELAEKDAELAQSKTALESIRQAIKDLGTGVPTLTKLTAFLSAVKEAIHYEG